MQKVNFAYVWGTFTCKYSLNNNILNSEKIVCVGSIGRGHPWAEQLKASAGKE